jgi:hypothetical protein
MTNDEINRSNVAYIERCHARINDLLREVRELETYLDELVEKPCAKCGAVRPCELGRVA